LSLQQHMNITSKLYDFMYDHNTTNDLSTAILTN
jgi:hypothetical protein